MIGHLKKRNLLIAIIVILAVLLIGIVLLWRSSEPKATEQTSGPSFSFNESAAPEWWSSGGSTMQPDDPNGTPEATILIFSGTKDQPGNCFVMAFYNKGSINIPSTLKARELGLVKGEDASKLHRVGTPLQTIATPEGTKSYTLYQYSFDIPDIQQGNEFGFIPLKDGYVEVRGICPTSSLLHDTTVPLSALKLNN